MYIKLKKYISRSVRCICSLFIILQVSLDYECVRSNLILAYLHTEFPLHYRVQTADWGRVGLTGYTGNKVDGENSKYSPLSDILSRQLQLPNSPRSQPEPVRDVKSTMICCWLKRSFSFRNSVKKQIMASEVACKEKSLIGTEQNPIH